MTDEPIDRETVGEDADKPLPRVERVGPEDFDAVWREPSGALAGIWLYATTRDAAVAEAAGEIGVPPASVWREGPEPGEWRLGTP